MSEFVVEPGATLAGAVRVPGDKSISHRALMLGAIASGRTVVRGFLRARTVSLPCRRCAGSGLPSTAPRRARW